MFWRSRAPTTLMLGVLLTISATSCTTKTTSSSCTGTSPILRERGTLTVAADLTYPPFAYDRPNDIPAGFEADLIRAIGKELKMDVLFVNRATSALVPGLLGHRHDVAAAGLIDTDDLTGETCTSTPYMSADLALVVSSPDPHVIEGPDDLEGRPVGVLRNSRAEDWVREHMGGSDIRTMPADADLIDALADRTVDAIVEERAVALYAMTKHKDVQVASVIPMGTRYVMAVAPDNGALMSRIDRALGRLNGNSKLAKIKAKWFGPGA